LKRREEQKQLLFSYITAEEMQITMTLSFRRNAAVDADAVEASGTG
jgi:hypothetical protein